MFATKTITSIRNDTVSSFWFLKSISDRIKTSQSFVTSFFISNLRYALQLQCFTFGTSNLLFLKLSESYLGNWAQTYYTHFLNTSIAHFGKEWWPGDEIAPQALMELFGGTQVKPNIAEFSAECHTVDCNSDSKVLTELQIAIRSKLLFFFGKFKVALHLIDRILINFAKSCILSCLSKLYNKKKFYRPVFEIYKRLKLKLRVFLVGHSVAMATFCVTKIIPMCSPVIGQFFGAMIVASIDKVW